LTGKLAQLEDKNGNARLNYDNIERIVSSADTPEKALSISKLAYNKEFLAKIDSLDVQFGNKIFAERLQTNTDIDIERMNKLYTFLKENKLNLQQYGEERITNEAITNLFDVNMIKATDLLDDGAIKYATKLKYNDFKKFIYNTSKLTTELDKETYSKLKTNLSKLTTPELKIERLQNISGLIEAEFRNAVTELIDMIKSPKTTVPQIKLAEEIFTSDKSYPQQIQEFLTNFNVPAERKDKLVEFLEKNRLNEKIITDSNSNIRTLSNKAKEALAPQIEAHINVINHKKEFNSFLNSKIYEKLKVAPTPELLEKLNFDQQYLSNLFSATSHSGFSAEFTKLIELVKTNPSKPLSELRETLEHNQQTKKLFQENGLNYEKWTNFDKNSAKSFSLETSLEDAIKSVEQNIVEELNGDLFKSVEKTETDKILHAMTNAGYKLDSNSITKNGGPIIQKDLEKIVDIFKDTINKNTEFWDKPLADSKAESLKNELIDHLLKGRKKEVADLASMQNVKMDLAVRLSDDDDIGRNIFLGNHVGCCTSVGGSNGFAAPQHLMNSFVRAMEIVDKNGVSYGNSMCYFAKVDDKLSFIIDSFEANGKLGGNEAVTDAIIDYAKQVTKEMGKPNTPIYFGPNYNKISMDKLQKTLEHDIEIVGKVDEDTYIDAIDGNADVNIQHANRTLFCTK